MSQVFHDGSTDSAIICAPTQVSYPFTQEGDTQTKIVRQFFHQKQDRYRPFALDVPSAEHPGCYHVGEVNHQNIGGGVMQFERVFASIPRSRQSSQTYAWTRPGIQLAGSAGVVFASSWIAEGVPGVGSGVRLTFSAPHPFSAGDEVRGWASGVNRYMAWEGRVHSVVSATIIIVSPIRPPPDWVHWPPVYPPTPSGIPMSVAVLSSGVGLDRPSKTVVVPVRIQRDYYLPGVSPGVSSPNDIPILQMFEVLDPATQAVVDTITNATEPTAATYRGWMSLGTELVAETSTVERWMGNIYERVTLWVKAS